MQTEPPPRAKFSDTVNQFVIYDAYVSYEAEKELQEENDKRGKTIEQNKPIKRLLGEQQVESSDGPNDTLLKSAKILERMVNQNTFNEIALGNKFSFKFFNGLKHFNRKLVSFSLIVTMHFKIQISSTGKMLLMNSEKQRERFSPYGNFHLNRPKISK